MAKVVEGADLETWVYCGRRWSGSLKKIYYLWRDANGEELTYDKVKATIVGGIYTLSVKRGDESVSVYKDTATWTGDYAEDRTALVAEDHQAQRNYDYNLGVRKAAKNPDLFDEVADKLAAECKSFRQVEAFVSILRDRLYERVR